MAASAEQGSLKNGHQTFFIALQIGLQDRL
jgi:hypothetical protein